ncbi:MAG: hypothetical protein WB444_04520 [Gallionella sp.]
MADQSYSILLTAADETKAAFESANGNIEKLTGGLISLQGLLGAVSIGAMVEMVKSTTETADQMGKAAEKIGTTTEALSRLQYAASLASVPADELQKGMEKLSKSAYEATTIGGTMALSYEQLGISTTDTNGKIKDSSVLMSEIADRFSHMENGSTKTALAMSLFGKSGADLIPLLNEGQEGLKKLADEADRLGITIGTQTTEEAKKFNEELMRMHAAGTGITNQITAALLPMMNQVAEAFVGTAKDTQAMSGVIDIAAFSFRALASAGAVISYDFRVAGDAIGAAGASLAALAHGDFAGVSAIGKALKEDIASANKDLVDFEERLAHPPAAIADKKKPDFTPKVDDQAVKVALDKVLAAAKSFDDQANVAHEDAFNKWLVNWKKIEDELTAAGAAGAKARAAHEAAYTVYVNAENEKRLADAQKAEAAKAKQLEAALRTENDYFAKLHAMAKLADKSAEGSEQQRYQDQVIEYQAKYDLAVQNHALSLAEEGAFQSAFTDIQKAHYQQQLEIGRANALQQLSVAGTQYKAMFELNKVVRMSEAVVDGWAAVQKSYTFGSSWGGPAGGAAMAAIAAAAVAANVAAIQGASFGGGSGANGSGGGSGGAAVTTPSPLAPSLNSLQAPAPTAATPVQAPQQVNITIAGNQQSVFTYDQVVNQLIPTLNQAAGNGVNINVKLATV